MMVCVAAFHIDYSQGNIHFGNPVSWSSRDSCLSRGKLDEYSAKACRLDHKNIMIIDDCFGGRDAYM